MRLHWPVWGLLCGVALIWGCFPPRPQIPDSPDTPPEPTALPALFEDFTATSRVAFTYRNGEETANHLSILESLGGGVGLIDFDGDGWLDLFFPGGGHYAGSDQRDIVGHPCQLFRNRGDGTYEDVTAAVGLDRLANEQPWFYTHAVAVADFDRDGWPDLLVTGWGRVALFRNVPDPSGQGRRFLDITSAAGLATGFHWPVSAAFGDLDGDGFPDLYITQYVDWSWQKHPRCTFDGKLSDICPPREFHGLTHRLFRNTGTGRFVDVTQSAGLLPGGPHNSKGLGVVFVDIDGDGKPDIYVANDTTDNYLYLNRSRPGEIRLVEKGLVSGVARDARGTPNGSMGVDAGDPERTGQPTLWVTNYENELPGLYRNECQPGRPFFDVRSTAAGIAALGQKYVGWGTGFADFDLDGWEDLFIANGHVIRFPAGDPANRKQRPVLLLNRRGRFEIATSRLGPFSQIPRSARGVAFGDLDNDGRIDLVISNINEPAVLLRGLGGAGNHWLGVQLLGKDNACVVGTRVTLQVEGQSLTRFARGGGSFASSGDRRLHFGLGPATTGRLRVRWPDGSEQDFGDLPAGRYNEIQQGRANAVALPVGGGKKRE